MLDEGADRTSIVVAVGGGVVGDLAGFVAATFARGLDFFQVPTTLLAQVDSSVGGKVGVNLPGAKNMVGAFWQPARRAGSTSPSLATLPDREYRSGLAEVVKYGVILDAEFFAYLEANVDAINRSDAGRARRTSSSARCRLKADVVEQDEREETGLRAVLNYGHTFAHAFEAVGGYGIAAARRGGRRRHALRQPPRRAPRPRRRRQSSSDSDALLDALHLTTQPPEADGQELLRLMYRDKKVAGGRLRFVLPDRIGHVELVGDVREEDVLAALDDSWKCLAAEYTVIRRRNWRPASSRSSPSLCLCDLRG